MKQSFLAITAFMFLAGLTTPAHAAPTNLALNKTATASSVWNEFSSASNAVDGNPGSEWGPASASSPPWLKVDLGSVTQFDRYVVQSLAGRYNSAVTLEVSNDDSTWILVDNASGNIDVSLNRTLAQPVSARYVRVTIQAWSMYPDIAEFELYNSVLPAPTDVAAAKGNGQVTLNWSSVSDADSYKVYQGTSPGVYDAEPVTTVSGTTATVTGLTNGTTYYFVVKASNADSDSANSNEASATPQVAAPAAPTGLAATAGNGQVTLKWDSISDAISYKVYQGTASGEYDADPVAAVSDTAATITGLTSGTTYYYVVKASNAGGDSDSSNEASATTSTVPSSPTNVTAVAGNGQAIIRFDIPEANGGSPITGYEVTTSTGNITVTGAASPIAVTGLTNGTAYSFTVKAINGIGSSAASAPSNAVTPTAPSSGSGTPAPAPAPTPITTPTTVPKPAPDPETTLEPVQPAVDVFKSTIVNVGSLVKSVASKVEEANKGKDMIEFADIQGYWAEKAIRTFVKLGFIDGYEDGQFRPNGSITRAEFAALISRVFDIKGDAGHTVVLSDVGQHWAKEAILSLASTGVINGYGDGSFKPNQTITREEIVMILSRILNLDHVKMDASKGEFTDISRASSYARSTIKELAEAGIIQGVSNSSFDPQGKATRSDALMIILNTLNLNPQVKALLDSLS